MKNSILASIPSRVCVVAVSKLQPVEKIRALHQSSNHLDFGENYVQEALAKMTELKDLKLRWHFIGRLQRNKLKSIVGNFDLIHSVDDEKLIDKISQVAGEKKITQKILLQVNLSGEESKGGFDPHFLEENFSKWVKTPSVKIVGLMTMPPLTKLQTSPSSEPNKKYFLKLRQLAEKLQLSELSMGTSSDYVEAIQEGATLVRLGTILFGERPS